MRVLLFETVNEQTGTTTEWRAIGVDHHVVGSGDTPERAARQMVVWAYGCTRPLLSGPIKVRKRTPILDIFGEPTGEFATSIETLPPCVDVAAALVHLLGPYPATPSEELPTDAWDRAKPYAFPSTEGLGGAVQDTIRALEFRVLEGETFKVARGGV